MVRVLPGISQGRYPHGNSVFVAGTSGAALIDPSLSLSDVPALLESEHVDQVLISHCHEDHLAGLHRFPGAEVHVHAADRLGLESIDGLMQIYGMPPAMAKRWRAEVLDRFHYTPRADVTAFADGDAFDLGGTKIHVVHLPGHTRGHSGFLIEPDGVMFLADVDLTGFGPYYGDAWSSIEDFERTIERCRAIEARQYVTFHHKGVINSRREFRMLLDEYRAVIERRDAAILDFLAEPHTLDEMVAHRFVYRPHVELLFVDAVERRSAELHLERLMARHSVTELSPGLYRATGRRR